MKTIILSFIIPFYNLEEWLLKRCVESILEQHLDKKKYEIIIIDDGSISFPYQLLQQYSETNIIYFHQENKGLGEARNAGIKIAKGKYIQFIDADDYLFENVLPTYFPLLSTEEFDLINFDFQYTSTKKREKRVSPKVSFQTYTSGAEYMLLNNLFGCAWLYVLKKELITNHNIYFSQGIFHEDEEFTPKIFFFAKKMLYCQLAVYAYYQRTNSIIKRKDKEHLNKRFSDFKQVIKNLLDFKEKNQKQSSPEQINALERKINLLVCDYLINMFRNHYTYSQIECELQLLNELNLFPLPDKSYSFKYKIFKTLSSGKYGIKILYLIEIIREAFKS